MSPGTNVVLPTLVPVLSHSRALAGELRPLGVVELIQSAGEPCARLRVQHSRLQVSAVLAQVVPGLMQQGQLGSQVSNAVNGLQGALLREPDAGVALESSLVTAAVKQHIQLRRVLGVQPGPELLAALGQPESRQQRAQ